MRMERNCVIKLMIDFEIYEFVYFPFDERWYSPYLCPNNYFK